LLLRNKRLTVSRLGDRLKCWRCWFLELAWGVAARKRQRACRARTDRRVLTSLPLHIAQGQMAAVNIV
jgi:hypothetical protein